MFQQGDIDEIITSVDLNSDNPKNVEWIEMKGMEAIEKIEILVKSLALQGMNDIRCQCLRNTQKLICTQNPGHML